jgi:CubicO group peptidase (beta-lactamase class C family)
LRPLRLAALLLATTVAPLPAQATLEARIDSIFAEFNKPDAPGCALGLARNGRVLLERAWGMAHLERRIPNRMVTRGAGHGVSERRRRAPGGLPGVRQKRYRVIKPR